MTTTLTKFSIGYSVVAAAILLVAYVFFIKGMRKTPMSILACACLLASLSGLQLFHWQFLATGLELFQSLPYVVLLLITPPMFYFFSREILLPESKTGLVDAVHLLPTSLAFVMPSGFVVPIALSIGVAYSVWLVRVVFGLRRQVRRFKFEVFFFGFFALVAILVLILAAASNVLSPSVFYIAYANMTGLAFVLIVMALISFPELLDDISAAAELAYSTSTLKNVAVDEKLEELDRLMREDKIFENENLNLNLLAGALDLKPHQLSELINTQFGFGFSRYLREQRVAAAKNILREDQSSSILSISLMTGFKSQSNFYTAFREVTGQSPGAYRNRE